MTDGHVLKGASYNAASCTRVRMVSPDGSVVLAVQAVVPESGPITVE